MDRGFSLKAHIVDVISRRIVKGTLMIENGKIANIIEADIPANSPYVVPGFIDSHVHIESSMLIPSEFARLAVVHGTVGTVSDPHEIANVLGMQGVMFMIENGKKTPFKFCFGAPSCVPATPFETSGAALGLPETEELLMMPEIHYLSEMMNFPGVLFDDKDVVGKLKLAAKYGKPVDGHAPGVLGKDAEKYIDSGISTDHECFTLEEGLEKAEMGMIVQIREGSAAKNYEALIQLLNHYPDKVMFCSDDKHPNDLVKGHMNEIIKRAFNDGYDLFDILRACTYVPKMHYKLNTGLLQIGDPADFVVLDNLIEFTVLSTFINGEKVAECGKSLLKSVVETEPNIFKAEPLTLSDLELKAETKKIRVFKVFDGELITEGFVTEAKVENGLAISDPERDILKMIVLNRYDKAMPAFGFIQNFGFNKGAIASTVAHDSHNIIAVGTNDRDMMRAINLLIQSKGGISLVNGEAESFLPLPVAGLMSAMDGYKVAELYEKLDKKVKQLGTKLRSPYMTLSFMALLVIPDLKLSDKGLFDGKTFSFIPLFV
jgi:adenine deaminase